MSIKKLLKVFPILICLLTVTNIAISKSIMETLPLKTQNCINAADEAAIIAEKFKDKRDLRSAISSINALNLPLNEINKLKGFLVILHLTDSKDIDPSGIRTQYYFSCTNQT